MSKGGHLTPIGAAMVAIEDARKAFAKIAHDLGSTDEDIAISLCFTMEQARSCVQWAVHQ